MTSNRLSLEHRLRVCPKHRSIDCISISRWARWQRSFICRSSSFHILQSTIFNTSLQIGGGVLGDCWRTEERGQAIALYSLAPLLGPVIGPACGAWVAQRSTWRWVVSLFIFRYGIQPKNAMCLQVLVNKHCRRLGPTSWPVLPTRK